MDAAQRRSLEYFEGQHCAAQWNDVMRFMLEELFASGGEEDAGVFLRHIGSKMATEQPLPDQESLEGLERSLNAFWQKRQWGWVTLKPGERRLTIQHGAFPTPGKSESERRRGARAAAAILAGAYSTWLAQQGGDGAVPLRLVTAEPGRPLEFVYGKDADR